MSDPYPPCDGGELGCPSLRYKYSWPELVGKPGKLAKQIIEKDNHFVTVLILKPGDSITGDRCCNRVYFWVDDHGNVTSYYPPRIG
ncbi:putative proteinase inhibitor I13, potato inhibitor I [Rosa chinensis]|uniref:Proteinase inhibitor I13, potato inhibitor I n=1 Tax=Rosa chinensis TaxID=74649 RepID=A0A2P6PWY5_ROSCH|nr:putative proteinase inhibitor I13, potato inhibitor I [Rosa chinensis]